MPEWQELIEVAFIKERTRARRVARQTGCSEAQALHLLMEQVASPSTLADLIVQRKHTIAATAAKRLARRHTQALVRLRKQTHNQAAPSAWQAWFDGSATPNPGRLGIGGVLRGPAGQQIEFSRRADFGDSNQAEYQALIALLQTAIAHNCAELVIYGDSQIVIDDVLDRHPVPCLHQFRSQARLLLSQLPDVRFLWIPREKNYQADLLCRRANLV